MKCFFSKDLSPIINVDWDHVQDLPIHPYSIPENVLPTPTGGGLHTDVFEEFLGLQLPVDVVLDEL